MKESLLFFHFCFDLPHVSNCYESDSFIFFDFWTIFFVFIFLFIFALTFHKCQIVMRTGGLITAAGEAYDSGRGADYRGGKGL